MFIFMVVSTGAVYGYQIIENSADIDGLKQVQTKQALTDKDVEYIQKDVEALDDGMKELNDKLNGQDRKLDMILQRLRAP